MDSPPHSPDETKPTLHTAFFYGTLMAPKVLHRVCFGPSPSPNNNPNSNSRSTSQTPLTTTPALLPNFRRHRVKSADYPAILPAPGASVRGLYVTNLTAEDLFRLDAFEGAEYGRYGVRVRLLKDGVGGDEGGSGEGEVEGEGEEVEADTYVWEAGEGKLEPGEWDFEEFKREKMRFWTGEGGEGEFVEVDEAVATLEASKHDGTGGRGANGHITKALEEVQQKGAVKDVA